MSRVTFNGIFRTNTILLLDVICKLRRVKKKLGIKRRVKDRDADERDFARGEAVTSASLFHSGKERK